MVMEKAYYIVHVNLHHLSLVHYKRFGVTCPHVEEDGH